MGGRGLPSPDPPPDEVHRDAGHPLLQEGEGRYLERDREVITDD